MKESTISAVMSELARRGAQKRKDAIPAARRVEIAKAAARARWSKTRSPVIYPGSLPNISSNPEEIGAKIEALNQLRQKSDRQVYAVPKGGKKQEKVR